MVRVDIYRYQYWYLHSVQILHWQSPTEVEFMFHHTITIHTFFKMSLSVVQLVAWSHEQPDIGWHITLIGWHSLLLILFSHQPRPAAAVHWTCSVATLFVGLTGTNLPSHFVPKFKSVYFGMIIIGFHRVQGFCIISTKILKIARFVELFNTSR